MSVAVRGAFMDFVSLCEGKIDAFRGVRLQKSCRGCFAEELSALHGKRFKAAMEGCVSAAKS